MWELEVQCLLNNWPCDANDRAQKRQTSDDDSPSRFGWATRQVGGARGAGVAIAGQGLAVDGDVGELFGGVALRVAVRIFLWGGFAIYAC